MKRRINSLFLFFIKTKFSQIILHVGRSHDHLLHHCPIRNIPEHRLQDGLLQCKLLHADLIKIHLYALVLQSFLFDQVLVCFAFWALWRQSILALLLASKLDATRCGYPEQKVSLFPSQVHLFVVINLDCVGCCRLPDFVILVHLVVKLSFFFLLLLSRWILGIVVVRELADNWSIDGHIFEYSLHLVSNSLLQIENRLAFSL